MAFPFVSVTSALHHCKPFLFSFTVWTCLFIVDLTVMQRSIHECSDFVRRWFGQCECFYSYSDFVLFVSVFLICIHVSLTVKLRVPVKRDQIKCNSWNQLKTLFLLNFSWTYEETDLTIKQLYQFLLSLWIWRHAYKNDCETVNAILLFAPQIKA